MKRKRGSRLLFGRIVPAVRVGRKARRAAGGWRVAGAQEPSYEAELNRITFPVGIDVLTDQCLQPCFCLRRRLARPLSRCARLEN